MNFAGCRNGMGWDEMGCYGWMWKDVPTIVLGVVNAFNARDIVIS
jgi:hypothetical protein